MQPAAPNTLPEPADRPLWPFPPALLDYPCLPPGSRPARAPAGPPPDVEPALF
jgi:hypothetical protein